jgi:uncharacterized protein YdbL (DUF1318 family)
MSFNILEKFIQGKSPVRSKCEDRIVITNNFVCVIDGATSKSDLTFGSKTQGVISGELIEKVVSSFHHDGDVNKLIEEINIEFNQFYQDENLVAHMKTAPVDRLNASLIIYSDHRKELWQIGDCQAIINGRKIENPKIIDSVLSDLRAFVIDGQLSRGAKIDDLLVNDTGREAIMPFLKEQSHFQNNCFDSVYSYVVLDGFAINPNQIKTYKVDGAAFVVLTTDGYPEIFDNLNEAEQHLKYILENDPLCCKLFKSTKGLQPGNFSFDDRAYVKLEITG